MIYQIVLTEDSQGPYDLELLHDNPRDAMQVCESIRRELGDAVLKSVLRDNVEISLAQLCSDTSAYEIREVIEEETKLPSTFRHGRGGDSDLAIGADGCQHGVWKPKNPEDEFS